MQALFTDAEVMGDLVHHGDPNLLHHFLTRLAPTTNRRAKDRDAVGQMPGVVVTATGERHTFIQPEQARATWLLVLHEDNDVVHEAGQFRREGVQGLTYEVVEFLLRELHHAPIITPSITPATQVPPPPGLCPMLSRSPTAFRSTEIGKTFSVPIV